MSIIKEIEVKDIGSSLHEEMEEATETFFKNHLEVANAMFDEENAFDDLIKYLNEYDRILYAPISNRIYKLYGSKENFDAGNILSNLDELVTYALDNVRIFEKAEKCETEEEKRYVENAFKVILKIRDHVTLANHQYSALKQSDEEYRNKFQKYIPEIKEEITKEMTSQLITLVGIFTALAFLVFGSITSLDGIFENLELPIFKTMSIGIIWGLCISNMIFVFLYCVGKMTKLSFAVENESGDSIWKQYSIVWWTNFFLFSLLCFTLWGHFIQQTEISKWVVDNVIGDPKFVFWFGTAGISLVVIYIFKRLVYLTTGIRK